MLIHITNLLLCADYVRKCILEELNQAKYYSIMVDATPNASYTEQTIFVLRYLLEETGEFVIKERFLTLVEYCEKTGAGIATLIVNALNDFEIPFANCHGQGYGNAENVCCKYNGTLTKSVHLTSARYLKTHITTSIFCTLPVTVASAERSFSKLSLIKNLCEAR